MRRLKFCSETVSQKNLRLFSDPLKSALKKEKEKKEKKKGRKKIGAGILLGTVGSTSSAAASVGCLNEVLSYTPSSEKDNAVHVALRKKAKEMGVDVERFSGLGNAGYIPSKELIVYDDTIPATKSSSTLAHEMGHAYHDPYTKNKDNRSKNIIAKGAHSAYGISESALSPRGLILAAANGYSSGVKAEKDRQEGKKETVWNKTRSVALPAAAMAPMLVAEASASIKGQKFLKEAGADKQLLKESRNNNLAAFGTYAANAAIPVIVGQSSRLVGIGVTRLKKLNKDKKKERNKKDEK